MVRKGNQRWPVLGKMADLNVKAGDKSSGTQVAMSRFLSHLCASLSLAHKHTEDVSAFLLPCRAAVQM